MMDGFTKTSFRLGENSGIEEEEEKKVLSTTIEKQRGREERVWADFYYI